MTYNSRRAQELSKWAESLNKGDRFHDAMFKAYFVDGLNIAKIPILTGIVESIGLSGDEAEQVLSQGTFKEAVDRDWAYSRACNITAVPTFMVNDKRAVGAQPYETLHQLVSAVGGGLSMA
jgi:predicted DsbA family dithiol-disulfide isomerase